MGTEFSSPSFIPPNGSNVRIQHDAYSKNEGIPDELLANGSIVKVLKTSKIYSTTNAPPMYVSTVQFPNGKKEAYPTANLRKI